MKQIFKNQGLVLGRMLYYSRSEYRANNPNNVVYFNANILTLEDGIIWCGDLDLTKDSDALKRISIELEKTLYTIKESDSMGDNLITSELVKKSVWDTTQETPVKK